LQQTQRKTKNCGNSDPHDPYRLPIFRREMAGREFAKSARHDYANCIPHRVAEQYGLRLKWLFFGDFCSVCSGFDGKQMAASHNWSADGSGVSAMPTQAVWSILGYPAASVVARR
jgi:hypothetical protein